MRFYFHWNFSDTLALRMPQMKSLRTENAANKINLSPIALTFDLLESKYFLVFQNIIARLLIRFRISPPSL